MRCRFASALFSLLATALTVGAVGCGGSGGEATSTAARQTSAAAPATTAIPPRAPSVNPSKGLSEAQKSGDHSPAVSVTGFRVLRRPSKAQLAIAPGHDNSLSTFGKRAQGTDLAAILTAVRGYFTALGSGNYTRACPYLADSFAKQLQGFSERARAAQKQPPLAGCAAIAAGISLLTKPGPAASEARLTLDANVLRVGTGDEKIKDTAIMVFRHHGGSSLYFFTMRREGGRWKAIALVPTPWPHT